MKQYVLENKIMIKDELFNLSFYEEDLFHNGHYYEYVIEMSCDPIKGGYSPFNVQIVFDVNDDDTLTVCEYDLQEWTFTPNGEYDEFYWHNLDDYLQGTHSSIDKIKSYLHKYAQNKWLLKNAKHKGGMICE